MDWTSKQEKALEMISKYGADIRLVSTVKSSYNATQDAWTAATTSYPTKGLFTQFHERDINGTTIQVGDRKLLIPAKDLPNLDELDDLSVYWGTIKYDPVNIDPLIPGGSRILYTIQVRG